MNVMRDNNLMNNTLDILKRYKWTPTYKNIEKIKILYKIYAIEKSLFIEEIKGMVHEMHKQKRRYNIKGRLNVESSDLKVESNVQKINNVQDTLNNTSCISNPTPNIINPHNLDPPNSSSIISLFSNVSTIDDLSKVDFYKKEFNIKKSKRESGPSFSNTIKNLIDLIFIHRDESLGKSYLKKIYKLDPNQFLKNLKENQKEDVFFSKALRMGLQQENKKDKNEIYNLILDLPFYKKEDYWSVALRRGLWLCKEGREGFGECKGREEDKGSGEDKEGVKENLTSLNNPPINLDHIDPPTTTQSSPITTSHSLYSYSTLKDSYLDLSQFNESKLILESKIEIEEILKDTKEVNLRKSIPKGIVMKESSIVIYKKLSKFILSMKVYQIEKEGIQIIIEMGGSKGRGKYGGSDQDKANPNSYSNLNPHDNPPIQSPYFRLGSINGKLFYEILNGNLKERKFIDQDLENKDFIYFELISSGSKLKMNINSRVYNLTFFRIEKIVIGEGSREEGSTPHFKGVINKFLLVEGSDYKNCRM
ncbi:hypothetical protein NBO_38g0030 [Nosema bombycis CQ1]|uniref:Uncharacterized protein n=1 Tax=Nosema bombycis (strain CQ1 / CVCC 102059) TaxID=578461 RepID=R0KTH7_NOSB1|nr:hypothetical protein NBO_38g0030 [Nosema bombycis CQ1]|eukprot:EOB14121.1 hypothetical protein NBO_38g0030 [Nosema bombycis CQ1]